MSFDSSLDKQLIKLVEQNPILYDPSHEDYMETDWRERVWRKIGDELDIAAPLCKARWINIRDNMRRKLRRDIKKKKSGDETPSYKYKYEADLTFLMPFFKISQKQNAEKEGSVEGEDMVAIDNQEADQSEQRIYYDDDSLSESKSDVLVQIENPVLTARETHSNASYLPTAATSDPINVFLDAVGATLRNLNPYYLSVAKSRIFQVAQECEMHQILNKGELPPNNNNR